MAGKKRSELNGGNIRLRMMLKINVRCLSLASEMNDGNTRLRITLKIKYREFIIYVRNKIWFHLAPFAAKKSGVCL